MKKTIKIISLIGLIAIIGGIGGIIFGRGVLPYIATKSPYKNWPIISHMSEEVVTMNTTVQEIIISKDDAVRGIIGQLRGSIVMIAHDVDGVADTASTGIIVTGDGVIASYSQDLFRDASAQYTVMFASGAVTTVDVIMRDAFTGITFLQIVDSTEYAPIALARTKDLFVGQQVFEIGVDAAVRDRIIAGPSRIQAIAEGRNSNGDTYLNATQWQGFLQMTLMYRQRSMPLITDRGELAGLSSGTTGSKDVTMVLPVSAVEDALKRLVIFITKSDGDITPRGVLDLGMTYEVVTPLMAFAQERDRSGGVLVLSMGIDSIAALAGVAIGDHIIAVNDVEITGSMTLASLLINNESVVLHVIRDGVQEVVTLR